MLDIIIIGAGTAGLCAGIYASRAGKNVLIIESNNYGGQIINSIDVENYPGISHISGFDFASNLYNQAIACGCKYINEKVEKIEDNNTVKTNKNTYKTKAIIIATGLKKRALGLYSESDFIGKGISYCATCDGNFYKNKDVAIVGGGNTALEDALYLSKICNKVYLIHRTNSFRGEEKYLDNLHTLENVNILTNTNVISLNGDNVLESITIRNNNEDKILNISCLFIAIGQMPDNLKFSNIIKLDEKGYIISKNCETNQPNIFVAGDARTKDLRQLVTAASDGAIAATKAINYLNEV